MSRIEAALKRADGSPGASAGPIADELSSPQSGESLLCQYPGEMDGGRSRPAALPPPRRLARVLGPAPAQPREFPQAARGKLIVSDAAPVALEQYRRLAATLHELQSHHGTSTLMVTSALPQEGKTLTVTNLALTLSESYRRRVLLIDADLRRPAIHQILNLTNAVGLTEALASDTRELSLVTVTPHLSVLPGGRPDSDPMARLTSDRMRGLLEEAAAVFDWVLLDAPPVGIMPDANLLARLTQGVIFVIAAGSTPYPLVERAISEIGRESIVGTVLNRIDDSNIPETGYYDQYYGAGSRAE
jgi:protein-tyrosine kinase